jgi:hypothetical protein
VVEYVNNELNQAAELIADVEQDSAESTLKNIGTSMDPDKDDLND